MASPASPVLERPAEEEAPDFDEASLRLASMPPVAIGLPPRAAEREGAEAPAPEVAPGGAASQSESGTAPGAEAPGPGDAAASGALTPVSESTTEPPTTLTHEEHEREVARRIGEYQHKRDAEAWQRAQVDAQANFLAEQDVLLQNALDGDEDAKAQWEQNRTVQALRTQLTRQLSPALERDIRVAVTANLAGEYQQAYVEMADMLGDSLGAVHHERFQNAREWLAAVGRTAYERGRETGAGEARSRFDKEDKPAIEEAVTARLRAEYRGFMPTLDTSQGVAGGLNANGNFQTKADFDLAVADLHPQDPEYAAKMGRYRAIAAQRGWMRRR